MSSFNPIQELDLFCRFCDKVTSAQLDRSIAENGRTVDRNSIFEFYCTKCMKTFCFNGSDLLESSKNNEEKPVYRLYNPHERYFIGERIQHKGFKEYGYVVGKDNGKPERILVNFEKSGLRKLIQNM